MRWRKRAFVVLALCSQLPEARGSRGTDHALPFFAPPRRSEREPAAEDSYKLFPPGTDGNTGFNYKSSGGGGCQATVVAKQSGRNERDGASGTTCLAMTASHCFMKLADEGTDGAPDPQTGSVVFEGVRAKNALGNLGEVTVYLNAAFVRERKAAAFASSADKKETFELLSEKVAVPVASITADQIAHDTAVMKFDCTADADKYKVETLCRGGERLTDGNFVKLNKAQIRIGQLETKITKAEATHVTAPQTDPPVIPGDSGGLVMDDKGEACGVLSAVSKSPEGGLVHLAADMDHVRKVIEKNTRQSTAVEGFVATRASRRQPR